MVPLLLFAACAPTVQSAGPWSQAAALSEDAVIAPDGVSLALRHWPVADDSAPRAVILALHGFNDYSNAFDNAARQWANAGITTYAYDQRGFGETGPRGLWPGSATLTADVREVLDLLATRHPQAPLYLLGESMGAAVALATMSEAKPHVPLAGLILSAPAVQGWRTLDWLAQSALWLSAYSVPWWTATGRGLDIQASDNIEMLHALARDPLIIHQTRIDALYGLVGLMDDALDAAPLVTTPTLLLFGAKDELIDRDVIDQLDDTLSAPHRVAIYPNGWHMLLRDLQAEAVIDDIAHWIENPDTPLSSGTDLAPGSP
jgi:acylglycerol lipase